jgi:hypothetical protein
VPGDRSGLGRPVWLPIVDGGRPGSGSRSLIKLRDQAGDRDGTPEGGRWRGHRPTGAGPGNRQPGRRRLRSTASALGPDRDLVGLERDHDRPVAVGPQDPGAGGGQPVEGGLRWVPVRVAGTRRRHCDLRANGIDEPLGRRGPAAVMCDLEEVDSGQVVPQKGWIDAFLDIAHQQHPTVADLSEEHDRDVVDPRATIGWGRRYMAADRPQDVEPDLVDGQPVTRREPATVDADETGEPSRPLDVARTRTDHPRLEDPPDAIPVEQQRQAGDVVLVRVGEDHGVDPAVPRRDSLVEVDEQAVGVRPAIDEQPAAA